MSLSGMINLGGGGLLAAAGAVGGAGAGLAQYGAETLKHNQSIDLAKKMDELATKREVTMEKLRHTHEMQGKQFELRGRSAIAQFTVGQAHKEAAQSRAFQASEGAKKRASEEERARIRAGGTVEAARLRADAAGRKGPGKQWEVHTLKLPDSFDPTTHQPIGGSTVAAQFHVPTGRMFIPVGPDKYMPYVATPDGKLPDPGTTRRVDARAVQDLVNDPEGRTPSGNPKSEVFLQRNGFLPSSYFAALQARQQGGGGGGSTSLSVSSRQPARPGQPQGQTEMSDEDRRDIDNAPAEPELPEEAFDDKDAGPDGGMGAYNAVASAGNQ